MQIYQGPPGLCYHNTGNEKQTGEPSNHQTKERFAEIKNSAALVLHGFCLEKYTYFSFGNTNDKGDTFIFVIFKGIHKYFSKVLALNSKSGVIGRFNPHKQ